MKSVFSKIGGRKFFLFILLALIGAFLVWNGSLDAITYWTFATANYALYAGANVMATKIQGEIDGTNTMISMEEHK